MGSREMRFRNQNMIAMTEHSVNVHRYDGISENQVAFEYTPWYINQFMYDVVTPNFKDCRNAGEIINNPYFRYHRKAIVEPSFVVWHKNATNYLRHRLAFPVDFVYSNYDDPTADQFGKRVEWYRDSAAEKAAYAEALSRVSETTLQFYATLGELPETIRWMESIVLRVRNLLVKKKKILTKMSALSLFSKDVDAVSNFWLEMRYAVRPLLFEMDAAIKLFKSQAVRPVRSTARSFVPETTTSVVTAKDYQIRAGYSFAYIVSKHEVRTDVTYRSGILYKISADLDLLSSRLGLYEPLQSCWELVPFSFMIDWFVNIGEILAAYAPKPGVNPLASWVVESRTVTNLETVDYMNRISYSGTHVETPGFTSIVRQLDRRFVQPKTPLYPTVQVNLDWAKILDIALIGRTILQQMQKLKKK